MSENTAIEWADHTFNPWEGCQKTGSPACEPCYAEARNIRFSGGANWGPGAPLRRTSAANWKKPLKWNREAEAFFAKHGRRQRVFCASLADVFDNAVDPQWRADLWELIESTPNLDWMLLTKRIGNVPKMVPVDWMITGFPLHVWMGITVVTQAEVDRDVPRLIDLKVLVRFLSMEPLVEDCNLTKYLPFLQWVITGGMSGPLAMPTAPAKFYSLRDQCKTWHCPFLFKQWGEYDQWGERVGKAKAGRMLACETHDGFPYGLGKIYG